MKNLTHVLAGILVAACGLLADPTVQSFALSLVKHNPYLTLIVTCALGLAALYHNPKKPTE